MWKKESMYFPRVPKKILSLIAPTYTWPQINYYSQDDILFSHLLTLQKPHGLWVVKGWFPKGQLRCFFKKRHRCWKVKHRKWPLYLTFTFPSGRKKFPNYCITLSMKISWIGGLYEERSLRSLRKVQFGSVVSNSLRPHGLQHAKLPCPSPNLRACSNSCPSSH